MKLVIRNFCIALNFSRIRLLRGKAATQLPTLLGYSKRHLNNAKWLPRKHVEDGAVGDQSERDHRKQDDAEQDEHVTRHRPRLDLAPLVRRPQAGVPLVPVDAARRRVGQLRRRVRPIGAQVEQRQYAGRDARRRHHAAASLRRHPAASLHRQRRLMRFQRRRSPLITLRCDASGA